MKKDYIAVRTAYYKHDKLTKRVKKSHKHQSKKSNGDVKIAVNSELRERVYKSALAEFDHVLRHGKTNSVNVFDEFTHQNVTFAPSNCESPIDAYYKCRQKYKEVTGRNCRSDMNTLFEHVVVLSEQHVKHLEAKFGHEKVKQAIVSCLKDYSKQYADKYGFTNLGASIHFDEGKYDEHGSFIRNVHAHVMFFNYDFRAKRSNLKFLMNKGKDPKTGKTNELNSNFVDIQTLAFQCFKRLKFSRGKSKLLTLAKYLPKHQFLEKQLSDKKSELTKLFDDINHYRTNFRKQFKAWLESTWSKTIHARKEADLDESIAKFHDQRVKLKAAESVKQTKKHLNNSNNNKK